MTASTDVSKTQAPAFQYVLSIVFSACYATLTILYGALSVPLALLSKHRRHRIIISWTHLVCYLAKIICGVKYRVVGLENIEQVKRPVVVLSKHQSAWETFFLQGVFRPSSTILKKELLRIPFFGWGLAALQPIAIDRSKPREALRQVKTQGLDRLSQNINLILFPEGTRVPVGKRGTYARSGADIAIKAKKTIVPVAHNAGMYWGSGKNILKRRGTIVIVIGPPISYDSGDSKTLTRRVEDWIESTQLKIYNGEI